MEKLDERINRIKESAISLYRQSRPDRANYLRLEDSNLSMYSAIDLCETLKETLTDERIVELIYNRADSYLAFLAQRNIQIEFLLKQREEISIIYSAICSVNNGTASVTDFEDMYKIYWKAEWSNGKSVTWVEPSSAASRNF